MTAGLAILHSLAHHVWVFGTWTCQATGYAGPTRHGLGGAPSHTVAFVISVGRCLWHPSHWAWVLGWPS